MNRECRHPGTVWAAALAGLTAYEMHGVILPGHARCTLSPHARKALRTHTRLGKVALVVGWGVLSAWLIPHWCEVIEEAGT